MTTPAKVTVTRRCPNEGEHCFCTGVCMQPVSEREAIEALEGELYRRKLEREAWWRILRPGPVSDNTGDRYEPKTTRKTAGG